MKGENFCPLCGTKKGCFIKGLCEECFLKKHKLVEIPEPISFEQCRTCGKTKLFGKMVVVDPAKLALFVEKKIKITGLDNGELHAIVSIDQDGEFSAKVLVKGIIDNVPISFEKNVLLESMPVQCDACMRLSSQYHEAIIQLRAKEGGQKDLNKFLPILIGFVEAMHSKNSLSAVTDVSKKREGFDLKVGSKKAAQIAVRQMKNKFNAETKSSSVLNGVDKSGKEKYRFTFLVRV